MRIALFLLLAAALAVPEVLAQKPVELKTRRDSVSYAIGMNIGQNFKLQSIDVDLTILSAAMEAVIKGGQTAMTEDQAGQCVMSYQQEMMAKQEAERKISGAKNKAEGDSFLAENKKKDGVKTTESGLQYKVLVEGTGPKPTASDKVKTHYSGKLIDGTEFDSSYKRGEPAVFPVTGVIKGWTEALQMMTVGSKWQLFIPSELAYGERGAGQTIGPNAALVFDIELLGIEK
ncbi:MAG: FKBP-type peptidyl-prolyl cis-trans isomerase [Ignavibacteriae bacterium]|nr:FKBP-type peptidyl-prolyl cis-trans isomerase [Ignavibacteriota bacterium]